ncbi:MAG TPA: leucyl/phenylalanyl-tRNA--protein transferase [Wenzhouxiangella sp.]|nr:leucyl/phenylalanyl-tRNA--protein transferase [Wenzhouxiangella sp.]
MPFPIIQLDKDPHSPFPNPLESANDDGLVAMGGDLHPERLLNAYRAGIFPWYEDGGPILWWSPQPRAVMLPGGMYLSRRFRRTLRQGNYRIAADTRFDEVIAACAAPRQNQEGTWITAEMKQAYSQLHRMGHAHSIEVHDLDGHLIGGLYGLALGRIFFAESKFHRRSDASKIALAVLMKALDSWGFILCDCQIWNPHLERLGVNLLSGELFAAALARGIGEPADVGRWQDDIQTLDLTRWP